MVLYTSQRETEHVIHDLAESIQKRDVQTYEHCLRVSGYAGRLARRLGWDQHDAHQLALAALVHDLGKTWIGNDILLKETALSTEERLLMERHPVVGAQMLAGYDLDPFFVETVLHHHEAYDGHGYPAGLTGEEIPIGARMLAVADVYDALISARPYKAARSSEDVCQHLLAEAGRRFDPRIVKGFLLTLEPEADRVITRQLSAVPKNLVLRVAGGGLSGGGQKRPSGPILVGQV
jgi:putative two-component system response regulator